MDLEILKIASDTKNHRVLKNCSHFAKFKNPLCGDKMNVSLIVKEDKITDFGVTKLYLDKPDPSNNSVCFEIF